MDEFTQRKKIERATQVKAFMENPLFDEMFSVVRETILKDWQNLAKHIDGVNERERCGHLIYALDKLKQIMTRQVQEGTVAEHELQAMENARKRIA